MTISDQSAPSFEELVSSNVLALLRLAVMLTGRVADAEDVVQSALLRASRNGDRIATMASPLAYLRRAVINEHNSVTRRLLRRGGTVPLDGLADATGDSATSGVDRRDEMWRMLQTLPRVQRTVLVLRYYEDLDDEEIADLLGCASSTVRSNASRAVATLRRRFDEELSHE